MAASFSQGVIRVEKLAIFSSSKEVDEFQIREFFLERWDFLSQGLDNGTMLFLAGVHGTEEGKLVENADSLETIIRQVLKSIKDLKAIGIHTMSFYFSLRFLRCKPSKQP